MGNAAWIKAQSVVTDCVLEESPDLVKLLINGNAYSWDVIDSYLHEAQSLKQLFVGGGDVDGYYHELQEHVEDSRMLEARMLRRRMITRGESS